MIHFFLIAFICLSSAGPTPVLVSGRFWSFFFYIHFILLVASGLGLQAVAAARAKLFHGGPMIDFLIGATGFMLLETAVAFSLGRGALWPALIPGAALASFGLRLGTGRALLG